jgi:hypothetical protein
LHLGDRICIDETGAFTIHLRSGLRAPKKPLVSAINIGVLESKFLGVCSSGSTIDNYRCALRAESRLTILANDDRHPVYSGAGAGADDRDAQSL